jgi:hypothetical protein
MVGGEGEVKGNEKLLLWRDVNLLMSCCFGRVSFVLEMQIGGWVGELVMG